MEEIVELHPSDFYPPQLDKLLLVDVGDIFAELEQAIQLNGEQPIHDTSGGYTDLFLMDIYHEIGYLPFGPGHSSQNIENVLAQCGSYFEANAFTGLQKELWRKATQALAMRLYTFRLYDHTHVNRYDYHQLNGDVLVLKLHE